MVSRLHVVDSAPTCCKSVSARISAFSSVGNVVRVEQKNSCRFFRCPKLAVSPSSCISQIPCTACCQQPLTRRFSTAFERLSHFDTERLFPGRVSCVSTELGDRSTGQVCLPVRFLNGNRTSADENSGRRRKMLGQCRVNPPPDKYGLRGNIDLIV